MATPRHPHSAATATPERRSMSSSTGTGDGGGGGGSGSGSGNEIARYYLSILDSITALCTFRDGSFQESSSDEELVNIGSLGGRFRRSDRSFASVCRPVTKKRSGGGGSGSSRTSFLDSNQSDPSYFLTLLRSGYPEIWEMVLDGSADMVVCVPQSASLTQDKLSLKEARAHVLRPTKFPGEYLTLSGWVVTMVGSEVVAGMGFPAKRRVRLLLSEDMEHYLGLAPADRARLRLTRRNNPLKLKEATRQDDSETKRGDSREGAAQGHVAAVQAPVDERAKARSTAKVVGRNKKETQGVRRVRLLHLSRPLIGGLAAAPENDGELSMEMVDKYIAVLRSYPEVESVFAEMDRFAADVVSYCSRRLTPKTRPPSSPSSSSSKRTRRGSNPTASKHGARFFNRASASARRLLHLPATTPPTMPTAPHANASTSASTAAAAGNAAGNFGRSDGGASGGAGAVLSTKDGGGDCRVGDVDSSGGVSTIDATTGEFNGYTGNHDGTGGEAARQSEDAGRSAAAAAADGGGDTRGVFGDEEAQERQREEQAELCAVVAEQWRKSAASLARSRCVRTSGGEDAKEKREVMLMQVTESYLLAGLEPTLGSWLAVRNAAADSELQRAIRLHRYHTQTDIGVKRQFQCDLSPAVKCLLESRDWCTTPMDKMLQIKDCLRHIHTSVQQNLDRRRLADLEDEAEKLRQQHQQQRQQQQQQADRLLVPSALTSPDSSCSSAGAQFEVNDGGTADGKSSDSFSSSAGREAEGGDELDGGDTLGDRANTRSGGISNGHAGSATPRGGSGSGGGGGGGHDEDAELATDDVVLLLVCCLIQVDNADASKNRNKTIGERRGILSDLMFIKLFHFCEDNMTPVGFAMSTLEVAVEWLLAKVGLRLAETPARNGLGTFLRIEKEASCLPAALTAPPNSSAVLPLSDNDTVAFTEVPEAASGNQESKTRTASITDSERPASQAPAAVDEWGGKGLSDIPPCLCHLALRNNVAAEIKRSRRLPLSSSLPSSSTEVARGSGRRRVLGRNSGKFSGAAMAAVAGGAGSDRQGKSGDGGSGGADSVGSFLLEKAFSDFTGPLPWESPFSDDDGDDNDQYRHSSPSRRASSCLSSLSSSFSRSTGLSGETGAGENVTGESDEPSCSRSSAQPAGVQDACNRVMVFGDAGAEQTTMFEVRDGDGRAKGGGEQEGGGGGGDSAGGLKDEDVDVVQVSCGPEYFAAVTRGGEVHTWGLEATGRLGHRRRREGCVRDGDGRGAGGVASNPWLKAPTRVLALLHDHVVQVSCGAQHVLAVTASGHLFAWGDNSRGQCGVTWSDSTFAFPSSAPHQQRQQRRHHRVRSRASTVDADASSNDSDNDNGKSDDGDGDGDSDWWDDYGGRGGVSSGDLSKLAGKTSVDFGGGGYDGDVGDCNYGRKDDPGLCDGSKGLPFGDGGDGCGTGAGDLGGAGIAAGEARERFGPLVVRRPTLVYLWRSSGVPGETGRTAKGDDYTGPPLRVLQVACGRQHSLALARSRCSSSSSSSSATIDANANTNNDSCDDQNILYSWGRGDCGRLGRTPTLNHNPAPLSRSSSSFAWSLRRAPSLRSLLRRNLNRSASGGGDDRLGRGGSASLMQQQQRGADDVLPDAYMPGEIVADWSYRVCDHMAQGGPLVPARPPPPPPPPVGPPGCYSGSVAGVSAASGGSGGGDGLIKQPASTFGHNDVPSGASAESRGGRDDEGMTEMKPTLITESGDEASSAAALMTTATAAAAAAAAVERRSSRRNESSRCQGPVAIAAGWRHSIAVTGEGAVFVWGCGSDGRLGVGEYTDVQRPQQVRALASRAIRIRQAAAGRAHTLFLSDTGTVYACGSDSLGQCGGGAGGSAGGDHIRGRGGVKVSAALDILAPRVVGGGSPLAGLKVRSVSAGDDHSSAVTAAEGDEDGESMSITVTNTTTVASCNSCSFDEGSRPMTADSCVDGGISNGGGGRPGGRRERSYSDGGGEIARGHERGGADGERQRSRVFTWGLNKAGQCVQSRVSEVVHSPQEAELLSGARVVGCGAGHTLVVL